MFTYRYTDLASNFVTIAGLAGRGRLAGLAGLSGCFLSSGYGFRKLVAQIHFHVDDKGAMIDKESESTEAAEIAKKEEEEARTYHVRWESELRLSWSRAER